MNSLITWIYYNSRYVINLIYIVLKKCLPDISLLYILLIFIVSIIWKNERYY